MELCSQLLLGQLQMAVVEEVCAEQADLAENRPVLQNQKWLSLK